MSKDSISNQTAEKNEKSLKVTNDYVFKKIFGDKRNGDITKRLVSLIIGKKIDSLKLEDTFLQPDFPDGKMGVLDMRALIDNNIFCNIEMQVVNQGNLPDRLLFYWSKIFSSEIKSGEEYEKLKKAISILIVDFDLNELKNVKKYITKWNIREEKYHEIILTDKLEIYIIELPKVLKYSNSKQTELDDWIKFIRNPEEVKMEDENKSYDKELLEARKILYNLSSSPEERRKAEAVEKYILDRNSARSYWKKEGERKGRADGKREGRSETIKQIVLSMFNQKVSNEKIAQYTGLDIKEIEKIIADNENVEK